MGFENNPTRKQVIMLLKKNSLQSVAHLSEQMSITPMAVRQHLMALEKQGIITYKPKKSGIGRPVFLYSLTEKARDIFPKSYADFIREMLSIIEDEDGRKKVDRLFQLRKERAKTSRFKSLSNHEGLDNKVSELAVILNDEGFMVELEEDKDKYILKQFNCPLADVASDYPEICKYELQLYSDLLGKDLARLECLADGASACVYPIPKA